MVAASDIYPYGMRNGESEIDALERIVDAYIADHASKMARGAPQFPDLDGLVKFGTMYVNLAYPVHRDADGKQALYDPTNWHEDFLNMFNSASFIKRLDVSKSIASMEALMVELTERLASALGVDLTSALDLGARIKLIDQHLSDPAKLATSGAASATPALAAAIALGSGMASAPSSTPSSPVNGASPPPATPAPLITLAPAAAALVNAAVPASNDSDDATLGDISGSHSQGTQILIGSNSVQSQAYVVPEPSAAIGLLKIAPLGSTLGLAPAPLGSTLGYSSGLAPAPLGSTLGYSSGLAPAPLGSTLGYSSGLTSAPLGSTLGYSAGLTSAPLGSTLGYSAGLTAAPLGSTLGYNSGLSAALTKALARDPQSSFTAPSAAAAQDYDSDDDFDFSGYQHGGKRQALWLA
jgi:hypothetical protein